MVSRLQITLSLARPEKHTFFRRLAPMLDRTLEKCERENGFIYHQKVPYDPVDLPLNAATHGLVAPEVMLASGW